MAISDTLKDQVVIVTGGGSGLGFEMAKGFLDAGGRVAICGRTQDKLDIAAQSLGSPERLHAGVCDVRDPEAIERFIDETTAKLGAPTGLVNNAAGNFLCPAEDLSPNAFRTVVDIVLGGTFFFSQGLFRSCRKHSIGGTILNIVTTYTERGSAFVAPSACAKAGVQALTGSLAAEWATYGMRVNAIAPGPFPTAGAWSRLVPDERAEAKFKKRIPMGRFGTPNDLRPLAVFLMSPESGFITGETIRIDGGEALAGSGFNYLLELDREDLKKAAAGMRKRT